MEKNVHNFKIVKVCELVAFFILEVVFISILFANKTLRSSIFVDRSLFTICMVMYFTILCVLAVIVFDFIQLRRLKKDAMELERLAYLDNKTGIPNRTSVNMLFDTFTTPSAMEGIGCAVIEISNIRSINSELGKATGDKIIRDFTEILESTGRSFGFVGRNGGNEYIVVIKECTVDRMNAFYDSLNGELDKYNEHTDSLRIEINSEYVLYDIEHSATFSELIAKAYSKLKK